jgi:hypothetical protein
MIVMPSGMSIPPPRPCRARKPMSMPMVLAMAHSVEPRVKRRSAVM